MVLEQSVDALDAAGGVVYALSADGRSLELVEQRGYPDDVSTKYASISLESRSPLADAARQRTPGFYESFERCAELYPQLRHALGLGGFEASVTLPLLTHGALLGAVSIRFRQPRSFDPNDRSWLLTLGELCAQALDRARLFAVESAARAGAESANRSKDEFLAMLGHELRSPLAPIVTALRLMKLRDGDASAKERMVIERQVSHLSHLVDDLLDIARITHGGLELKKESGFPFTFPVELANDCIGYVPTVEALGPHGGGYETRLTSYSNLEKTAGPQIVAADLKLAHELKPGVVPERAKAPPFEGGAWTYGALPPELD